MKPFFITIFEWEKPLKEMWVEQVLVINELQLRILQQWTFDIFMYIFFVNME